MPETKEQAIARLMRFVSPEPTSGCWLWTGSYRPTGYGQIRGGDGSNVVSAHRLSYRLLVGEIPAGGFILHRCDVRCCVNPDHLFLGTDQDNASDKAAKGRGTKSKNGLPCGVYRKWGRFYARVRSNGKAHHVGSFTTLEEAREAAEHAKIMLYRMTRPRCTEGR